MSTEAQKRANKTYRDKHQPIQLSAQYKTDKIEGLRIKAYLAETGQSANSYIKDLIKRDLDAKGVPYPDNTDNTDQNDD